MKHVGLNVAADPMFTASYTGVNGGLVICVADDPGMHSSQNEQDSRHYALAAKLPMLEPADSEECRYFTRLAFELSETYDTPVLLRLTTRVSHSRSIMEEEEPVGRRVLPYSKNVGKSVMMPAMARARHIAVEERMKILAEYAETSPLNTIEWGSEKKIGVITSGIGYQTAKEALGDSVSYLKLGMVNPLPKHLIEDFSEQVEDLWVIEELDDFLETHCKKLGISVNGKSSLTLLGEYTAEMLRKAILNIQVQSNKPAQVLPRPPMLCAGCPHRGAFWVLNQLKLTVIGDIGCYTLAATPPLSAMDYCLCMGASVSGIHGFLKARPEMAKKTVAVIGDSTFMHSGMTGLLNIVYNQTPATVLILDNSITGMTGHQQNPGTGLTLLQKPAPALNLEDLCRALGVSSVRTVNPLDPKALTQAIEEDLELNEVSVLILKSPCALLPKAPKYPSAQVSGSVCKFCKKCLQIGCPAISSHAKKAVIDPTMCNGCALCIKICPFNAISQEAKS
jgi:indolepyruvate ferredoxin oxidoreductase alpha subunit